MKTLEATQTILVPELNSFGQVIGQTLAPHVPQDMEMNAGHSTGYDWEDDDYDMPVGFRG